MRKMWGKRAQRGAVQGSTQSEEEIGEKKVVSSGKKKEAAERRNGDFLKKN